jgi:hypothetical protein
VENPTTSTAPNAATTSAPTTDGAVVPSDSAPGAGVPLARWIEEQETAGRSSGQALSDPATDAHVLVAYAPNDTNDVDGGLLLADGRVLPLPDGISTRRWPSLSALGGRPVILSDVGGEYSLWQLSTDMSTWSEPIELGLSVDPQSIPFVALLGDLLVVADQGVRDVGNGFYEPERFEGVLVSDELEIVPMAEPPAKQFLWVTSTVRTHALMLGLDSVAGANAPLTQPWDFDASTNEWSAVPIPDWLGCGTGCDWSAPHEIGDMHLEVVVGERVVKRLPDGTVGLYAPDTKQWTRVDDPPFELAGPAVVVLGDQLAVAPIFTSYGRNPAGTVGVLDLATGSWSIDTVDVGSVPENGFQLWEAHGDGTVALFDVIHPEQDPPAASSPDLVYDSTTRRWRVPTADEAGRWSGLGGGAMNATGSIRDLLSLGPQP